VWAKCRDFSADCDGTYSNDTVFKGSDIRQSQCHRSLFSLPLTNVLGAFANCEEATTSFVTSVRPPVRLFAWNVSAPTGPNFIKFYNLRIFRKYVEKIDVD